MDWYYYHYYYGIIIIIIISQWLSVKQSASNGGDAGDVGSIPGSGIYSGGGMATHSSDLALRIPRTEEPGGLQSIGSQRAGHDWRDWAQIFL